MLRPSAYLAKLEDRLAEKCGPKEADNFWSRAELNLLMAPIHYVCNLKDASSKLLPIEQRGLGDVYQLLANKSIQEINRTLAGLPALNGIRGFNMSCQVVVQSLSQWQEKYPGKETPPAPVPQSETDQSAKEAPSSARKEDINPAQDLEYSIEDTSGLGIINMAAVRGDDEEELDSPPGQ